MTARTSDTDRRARIRLIANSTALLLLAVGVVVGLVYLGGGTGPSSSGAQGGVTPQFGDPVPAALLVRPDSHRLGPSGDGRTTMVQFVDPECEACAAAHPSLERIRADYAGRVDVVLRWFPGPTHRNAEASAAAAEAAARQGRLPDMLDRLYETQPRWGERDDPQAAVFRDLAAGLGLDLARYDADVADPAVLDRVRRDRDDAVAAGVSGTPTFFVDGRPLEGGNEQTLRTALDEALAGP